jgi:hypothetical protein
MEANEMRKIFGSGVIAVGLLLLLGGTALGGTLNVYNSAGKFAWNSTTTVKLAPGCVVQLIEGASVVEPSTEGTPRVGNVLLDQKTIGPAGEYALTATLSAGNHSVYVRVWDNGTIGQGTYYGNSSVVTVNVPDIQPLLYYVNQDISANIVIAVTNGITPSFRGQGAQSQVVTVEGNYFLPTASVSFGDSNISYTTTRLDDQHLQLSNFAVQTWATLGNRSVTVTNTGAIPSNAQVFTIEAGPFIQTVTPPSLYQGDSGKLVTLDATAAGIFENDVTIALNGDAKVSYTPVRVSGTKIELQNLAIAPTASPLPRTITTLNPRNAGSNRGATNFTLVAPAVAVSPNNAIRGRSVTVMVDGAGTHFSAGNTTVTMEGQNGRVNISNINVISPVQLSFTLQLSPEATGPARTVWVHTPGVVGETEAKTTSFTINNPTFVLSPSTGILGTSPVLTVTGAVNGTNFNQGNTTLSFSGTGVTVNRLIVASLTSFTAEVTVATNAPTTPQNVTVSTTNVLDGTETMTNNGAFTPQNPATAAQVIELRALAEPRAGSVTLRWLDPAANYSGARLVYTPNYTDWNSLTTASPDAVDVGGLVNEPSTREIPGLSASSVYYFKVFSYIESGIKFFNTNGVRVAAIPAGASAPALSLPLTLETGVHGINHFSLPFPGPWYVNGVAIANAYDLVKAINTAAGSNVVSTFAKWVGPYAVETQGLEIAGRDPEPVRAELEAIPLVNGGGYQVYMTQPVTIIIRNTP